MTAPRVSGSSSPNSTVCWLCVPQITRLLSVPRFASSVDRGNGSFCLVDSFIMPLKAVRTDPGAGKGHSPVSHVDVIRHAAVARPRQWFPETFYFLLSAWPHANQAPAGARAGSWRGQRGPHASAGYTGKSGVAPRGGLDERRRAPASGQVRGDSRGSQGAPERPRVRAGAGGRSGWRAGRSPWRSEAAAGRRCAPSRRSAAGPRAGPQRARRGLPVRGPRREGQDAVPRSGAPGKARTWPQGRDRARGRLGPLHAPAPRGRFRLPGSRGPTSRRCAAASRGHLAGHLGPTRLLGRRRGRGWPLGPNLGPPLGAPPGKDSEAGNFSSAPHRQVFQRIRERFGRPR